MTKLLNTIAVASPSLRSPPARQPLPVRTTTRASVSTPTTTGASKRSTLGAPGEPWSHVVGGSLVAAWRITKCFGHGLCGAHRQVSGSMHSALQYSLSR